MKKLLGLTLIALVSSFASWAIYPITGTGGTCVGVPVFVNDSTTGGVWSSSDVTIASIGSSTGEVTGMASGTVTLTYTVGASYVTALFVVSPLPAYITGGPTSLCVGGTGTMVDASPGGTWSTSNPTIATIGSTTGVVNAVGSGYVYIYYTVGPGCHVTTMDTIGSTTYVDSITGPSSVCVGSSITLADLTSGGTWSSSSTAIATVSGTGLVTGVSAGTVNITYNVAGTCGGTSMVRSITVVTSGSAGAISGASTVGVGSSITLTDGVSGGTWSSSSTGIATVGAGTGLVTGVSTGVVTITYTVAGCSGSLYTTHTVTVTAAPPVNRISGYINFSSGAVDSLGSIKVWLITYNPSTLLLQAIDSTTVYSGGTSAYYDFMGEPTDSFRVKAAYFPPTFSSTGYVPTYHLSSFYWNTANVFYHTTTTTNDSININMAYGTVTAGAGFIGGNVTTGANRGTSGSVPAVGLLVLALNSTGSVVQQAYTDASGNYTFSNLSNGSYTIYPEALNYATTAYPTITLTTASHTVSAADFIQHTVSHTITPIPSAVQNVNAVNASVFAFPNPTTGKLNIQWNGMSAEKTTLQVADVTGKVVLNVACDMTSGSGSTQVDLSGLTDGVYLVSIKSATLNYNSKIVLQH